MSALWTAAEQMDATGGTKDVPFAATGISIDTRTLRPGDLFVALVGENGDGHDHVAAALAKGAAGALVHKRPPLTPPAAREGDGPESPPAAREGDKALSPSRAAGGLGGGQPLLLVPNTFAALHRLGAYARARFRGRLVAVTGSVGKTTTKEMLRTALAAEGPVHAAEASYNNHWGVPLTLARMPPDAAFAVIEIGMNHPGEIAPLAALARPHVACITAVERAHVGHMGGIEAIADEKVAILTGLEPEGVAVLPRDSAMFPRLDAAVPAGTRTLTFGLSLKADVHATEIEQDADGSIVAAIVCGCNVSFRLNAAGLHMAANALGVLAAARALGVDAARAAASLTAFRPVSGRGARRFIALPSGRMMLLDESYNASSASVRAALRVLRLQPATRRIAVLGDMLELGDEGVPEHVGLAPDVADCADVLFACGPLMRHLYDAVPERMRGAYAPDAATLAPLVSHAASAGDAILIKGSLGSRMKLVVSALDTLAENR